VDGLQKLQISFNLVSLPEPTVRCRKERKYKFIVWLLLQSLISSSGNAVEKKENCVIVCVLFI
jgi:hypothetical protein